MSGVGLGMIPNPFPIMVAPSQKPFVSHLVFLLGRFKTSVAKEIESHKKFNPGGAASFDARGLTSPTSFLNISVYIFGEVVVEVAYVLVFQVR